MTDERFVSSMPVSHLRIRLPANPEGSKMIDGRYQRVYLVMGDGSEIDISAITSAVRPEIVAGKISRCNVEFMAYEITPTTELPEIE